MTDQPQIEELARRLGTERAERVDPEATADAVVARLRNRVGSTRVWTRALRAAAAVILVAGSGLVLGEARKSSDPAADSAFTVPVVLRELGRAELTEILDSLDFEAPVGEYVSGALDELSERELQELLAIMEG